MYVSDGIVYLQLQKTLLCSNSKAASTIENYKPVDDWRKRELSKGLSSQAPN